MIIDTEQYLTTSEFGAAIGEDSSYLAWYIKNGTLNAIKIWGIWLIHRDCLKDWPPKKTAKTGRPIKVNK